MGFLSSYIFITIAGLLSHLFYRKTRAKHKGFIAYYTGIVIFGILLLDILIYVGALDSFLALFNNLPWLQEDPIINGQDFMWNSFRLLGANFGIEHQAGMNWIAAVLFLSYMPWFMTMKDGSRMLFGTKTYEEGYYWAFEPIKKPKN